MFFYKPIGLSGPALVGKDTLCSNLINFLKENARLDSRRVSVAGDCIKNSIKNMLETSTGLKPNFNCPVEKEIARPLLVEYGRYLRNKTKGRYFVEKIDEYPNFGLNYIPIITDIRYCEYEKDELYWLKYEKKGILIFLERDGINPTNDFEKNNNIILKNNADIVLNIPNIENMDEYYLKNNYIFEKIFTTYQQDIFQPSNMS
jgi:hypothetical protein